MIPYHNVLFSHFHLSLPMALDAKQQLGDGLARFILKQTFD